MKDIEKFPVCFRDYLKSHEENFTAVFCRPGVFIVGGALRDFIMDLEPADFDLLLVRSNYNMQDLERFSRLICRPMVILGKLDDLTIRIPLSEGQYLDFLFADELDKDIQRRDFTVNSLAFDLFENRLVDLVGGLSDLDNGVLRSRSQEVIREDPLRILRGYRLTANGFQIDEDTRSFFIEYSDCIKNTAVERISAEFMKILHSERSHVILHDMHQDGVLGNLFPVLDDLGVCTQNRFHHLDVLHHSFKLIEYLDFFSSRPVSGEDLEDINMKTILASPGVLDTMNEICGHVRDFGLLKLAALFHDAGKPSSKVFNEKTGDISFYSHEKISTEIFREIAFSFKFPNSVRDYADRLIRHHMNASIFSVSNAGKKAYYRLLKRIGMESIHDFLLLSFCDRLGAFGPETTVEDILSFLGGIRRMLEYIQQSEQKINSPLIMGRDLIENFGLKPGKIFSDILRDIDERYNTGDLSDKDAAIEYIRNKYSLSPGH